MVSRASRRLFILQSIFHSSNEWESIAQDTNSKLIFCISCPTSFLTTGVASALIIDGNETSPKDLYIKIHGI